ncbi:unnamed protein product [Linum tenue]|uniref:NAC domain-containing protein n=1 Tax=Linum tenue TaxID=586396 RepID=A0AAV0JBM2_9ROSI|nr:unnamed protein product [Linum tenue]
MDLPPGFRFHPADEELISHYLYNKVLDTNFSCRAIGDVDLNKSEPWKAKMGEKEWYFFCVRDRKYPTGLRTNRATEAGYWKATGKDKEIYRGKSLVGMKKTLVFYKGRAPKGEKSDWVMHEYRLDGKFSIHNLPKTERVGDLQGVSEDQQREENPHLRITPVRRTGFFLSAATVDGIAVSLQRRSETQASRGRIFFGLRALLLQSRNQQRRETNCYQQRDSIKSNSFFFPVSSLLAPLQFPLLPIQFPVLFHPDATGQQLDSSSSTAGETGRSVESEAEFRSC